MPTWTRVSSPSDIKTPWSQSIPAFYRVHLRGRAIPRILGDHRQGLLYIGMRNNIRRAITEFIRCSNNGNEEHRGGQTLHHFRVISPGIAAIFGNGSVAPSLEFSYITVPRKEAAGLFTATMDGYIRRFGEYPPLNGSGSMENRLRLRAPKAGEWTFIKHPSELRPGRLSAIYRVHLEHGRLRRWLGTDPEGILEIGKAAFLRDRLNDFIKSALNGNDEHSEGRRLFQFKEASPGLRAMLAGGIPGCLMFSYREVDEDRLFAEENISTDGYSSIYGELPPLNGEMTGKRKRITELRKELGMVEKRT